MEASPVSQLSPVAPKRWTVAVAGIVIMALLGTVYAWSVFKKPLIDNHHWVAWQVTLTFGLTIFFLGFSAALGGKLVDKAGTRKVVSIAAVLFGLGTVLAGVADACNNIVLLWIGYGVIGGIGNGLGYITPIAVLVRWFPDKKGTITGLAIMGFGLGAALMGQIAPIMIKNPSLGIARTFYICGGLFLIGLLIAARRLVNPPAGYVAPAPARAQAATAPSVDVRTAMGMKQFYILWGLLFLNVTAGIAIISNLSPMAEKILGADGKLSGDAIKVLAGTIVAAGSLCNGFGRLFWAALSERVGRKGVFLILFATQIPLFILLPWLGNIWLFSIVACYIMLCYGGGFGTMPAFTADTFGPKNIGGIYGKILLAWGVAGLVGPLLMEWFNATYHSFDVALFIASGLLAIGFLLALQYRRPALVAAK